MATTDIAALLGRGLEDNFLMEYKTRAIQARDLFHVDKTGGRYVDLQGWIGYGAPQSRRPGGTVQQDSIKPNFPKRIVMVGYSLGDVIAEEDVMDDQYGMLVRWASGRGGAMAVSYVTLQERVAADFFATLGFGTAPVQGFADGQPLFSTAHPISAANSAITASNRPSTDIDLSMAALQAARANLDQQLAPNNYTVIANQIRKLVVNPNLLDIALQLAKGDWERGTGDLNMNVLKNYKIDVVAWPYFRKTGATSATGSWNAWFCEGETHYLCWYDREQVSFQNDKDINTRSLVFTSHIRFGLGAEDWRGTYGSAGS